MPESIFNEYMCDRTWQWFAEQLSEQFHAIHPNARKKYIQRMYPINKGIRLWEIYTMYAIYTNIDAIT